MKAQMERLKPMDPALFARKTLRQVAGNKPIVIVPSWWKALWWLERVSPSLSLWVAERLFESLARELDTSLRAKGAPDRAAGQQSAA